MKRILLIAFALALITLPGASQTNVTVAAGGVYPPSTTFGGVRINGLQSGYGVEITGTSALGQFCTVLLGVNAGGLQQNIIIQGKASSGSRSAANIATFQECARSTWVTARRPQRGAVHRNDYYRLKRPRAISLLIGATTLPNATVNAGSMTIR